MSTTIMAAYAEPLPKAQSGVGEDGDEHVLLHVERARVEAPLPAAEERGGPELARRQHARQEVTQRQRAHLHRDLGHDDRLRAVREELAEEAHEHTGQQPQRPHPERPHRQRRVVASRHRQSDLLDRRRVVELRRPGDALDVGRDLDHREFVTTYTLVLRRRGLRRHIDIVGRWMRVLVLSPRWYGRFRRDLLL
jgi:hypothetical protein